MTKITDILKEILAEICSFFIFYIFAKSIMVPYDLQKTEK